MYVQFQPKPYVIQLIDIRHMHLIYIVTILGKYTCNNTHIISYNSFLWDDCLQYNLSVFVILLSDHYLLASIAYDSATGTLTLSTFTFNIKQSNNEIFPTY